MHFTGFEIHFDGWHLFGWSLAVELHRVFAWLFVILIAFAVFWHLTSGEGKPYRPTRTGMGSMLRFYLFGIFKGEPHPVKKTRLSKLNPLQASTYLGLKVLVIPVLLTTGLLYNYYNDWQAFGLAFLNLETVALIHSFAAFLMMAFMVVHIYLTTTGHTPLSNLKAMITGWEELEEDADPGTESMADDGTDQSESSSPPRIG